MRSHNSQALFAVCVDNSEYPVSLELHKMYRVLPDDEAVKHGDLRIIDESGEDYLYPREYFVLIPVSRQVAKVLNGSFSPPAPEEITQTR